MRVPSDGRSQGSTVAFWMPVASDIFPYAQSKMILWLFNIAMENKPFINEL
jgi:hypothetical protein